MQEINCADGVQYIVHDGLTLYEMRGVVVRTETRRINATSEAHAREIFRAMFAPGTVEGLVALPVSDPLQPVGDCRNG